jgi:hypothetical protein
VSRESLLGLHDYLPIPKIIEQINLKKERFTLAHGSEGLVHDQWAPLLFGTKVSLYITMEGYGRTKLFVSWQPRSRKGPRRDISSKTTPLPPSGLLPTVRHLLIVHSVMNSSQTNLSMSLASHDLITFQKHHQLGIEPMSLLAILYTSQNTTTFCPYACVPLFMRVPVIPG